MFNYQRVSKYACSSFLTGSASWSGASHCRCSAQTRSEAYGCWGSGVHPQNCQWLWKFMGKSPESHEKIMGKHGKTQQIQCFMMVFCSFSLFHFPISFFFGGGRSYFRTDIVIISQWPLETTWHHVEVAQSVRGSPVVTIGFSTKSWSNDLGDLGVPPF